MKSDDIGLEEEEMGFARPWAGEEGAEKRVGKGGPTDAAELHARARCDSTQLDLLCENVQHATLHSCSDITWSCYKSTCPSICVPPCLLAAPATAPMPRPDQARVVRAKDVICILERLEYREPLWAKRSGTSS